MAQTTAGEAEKREHKLAPFVFFPSLIIIAALTLVAAIAPDWTSDQLGRLQSSVIEGIGWYYVLIVSGFVVFSIWLGVSRYGNIKLGPDEEPAAYGYKTWFCMLFAAGMGIGLVFWGVAEPLTFYTNPKPGMEGTDAEQASSAMAQVFLHWGVHAWAIYAIVALAVAWAIHRRDRPVSIRWALEPLFGERVNGRLGDVIDVVAVVGTVTGVATSLGFGVSQIGAGLEHLGVVGEASNTVLLILIAIITAIATVSVVSGLDKGIKWLSNFNIGLAGVFAVVMLLLGSTLFLLRGFVDNIGSYLGSVVPLSFDTSAYMGEAGAGWQSAWTIFYWGWWISWAPFVGIFIARISRGRTIREFIAGILLVPVVVSTAWFSIMGGQAIFEQSSGNELRIDVAASEAQTDATAGETADSDGVFAIEEDGETTLIAQTEGQEGEVDWFVVAQDEDGNPLLDDDGNLVLDKAVDEPSALFGLIDGVSSGAFATILAAVAVLLITIFFVTSSDSGSLVVDMLCSGGDPNPPTWSRVLWSVIEGSVAAALILAGAGGLGALQTVAILTALPFSAIMILMCFAIARELNTEHREILRLERKARTKALSEEIAEDVTGELVDNFDDHFAEPVDGRIEHALNSANGDGEESKPQM